MYLNKKMLAMQNYMDGTNWNNPQNQIPNVIQVVRLYI